jgi:hypothetical protein
MRLLACSAFLAIALLAGLARADDAKSPPKPSLGTVALFGEAGFGPPFGWLAGGLVVRPISWWSLQAGGGLEPGATQGGVATAFQLRLSPNDFFGLLLGSSFDHHVQHNFAFSGDTFTQTWPSFWGYLGLQGHKRLHDFVFLRGTLGVTAPLAKSSPVCDVPNDARRDSNLRACQVHKFDGQFTGFAALGLEFQLF